MKLSSGKGKKRKKFVLLKQGESNYSKKYFKFLKLNNLLL